MKQSKRRLEYYPPAAKEREEGRICLEDLFDAESIEIDQLLYLALNSPVSPIWRREDRNAADGRKMIYLSEAFSKFTEKIKKEDIRTRQEYDEKYSIHYQCEEWLPCLRTLLDEAGDDELGAEVEECCEKMGIQ